MNRDLSTFDRVVEIAGELALKYSPDQPRDDQGQWTDGGGSGGGASAGSHRKLAAADAKKEMWAAQSPIKTVDHVYALAHGNQHALVSIAAKISRVTGAKFVNPGVKSVARTIQKLANQKRTPANLSDVVRGGFKIKTPKQADRIVAMLSKKFSLADEGWQVTKVGYFDRKVLLRMKGGQISEVQIWHHSIYHAKMFGGGHRLYEKMSRLPKSAKRQIRALEAKQRKIYFGASARLSKAWKAVAGRGGS